MTAVVLHGIKFGRIVLQDDVMNDVIDVRRLEPLLSNIELATTVKSMTSTVKGQWMAELSRTSAYDGVDCTAEHSNDIDGLDDGISDTVSRTRSVDSSDRCTVVSACVCMHGHIFGEVEILNRERFDERNEI
jgi:hypothetical protein